MEKKSIQSFCNRIILSVLFVLVVFVPALNAARYMENLNRGVVAVRTNSSSVYVGWRMFGTDPANISFNVYRGGVKVNTSPITASTNYTDNVTANASYYIRPVINGIEQAQSETVTVWGQQYLTVPLQRPASQSMPDGSICNFTANDASTADLDGDGEYEIILKWDPSNSKDNSQSGYTGDCIIDAYKLNGTRLWRINLGRNIRSGAHYTQFQVFDYDSDGKAELICKTAPGTKDSSGNYLSKGPAASDNDSADYRNSSGYILTGPEYLTVFNGETGREAYTTNYNPPRGTVSSWGDSYGNRVDRFLAGTAYLDGVHPSVVMCRGYYTRAVLAAYDWDGSVLKQRWVFDSNASGNSAYAGQGNHNLAVGDVDNDGRDEIVYGACAIDDNGKGLYSTGLRHGDAGHLGKMDPNRPGLQYFEPHETGGSAGGGEYRNAATGALLWGYAASGDTGRGMAADIHAGTSGYEFWTSATDGVYNINKSRVSSVKPSVNFRIYWDGDLQDELLDGTKLDKWTGNGTSRMITFSNYRSSQEINGTKANPCLSADILGDWREEVIYRNSGNTELNIFTTTIPTNYRFYTLMHDFVYRNSIAWQNTAYNQPPHTGFYLGNGPSAQPAGDIIYPGGIKTPTHTNTHTPTATATPAGYKDIQLEVPCSMNGVPEAINAGYTGDGYANLENTAGSDIIFALASSVSQDITLAFRFANGSENSRNMSVVVNGAAQAAGLNFASTGAWTSWTTENIVISLSAGNNLVKLVSLGAEGGPNLDMVSFVSTTVNAGSCVVPPTATMTNSPVPPTSTSTFVPPTSTVTELPPTSTDTIIPPTATMTYTAELATSTITNTTIPITSTGTAVPPTSTNTEIPSTATMTNTELPPTATWTNTAIPPTSTSTFVPPTATPTTGTSNFSVQLKSAILGSTNSPHPHIRVVNTGAGVLNLNGIEIKYWLNCDCTSGQQIQAFLDWAGKMPQGSTVSQYISTSAVTRVQGTQTHYVSFRFTSAIMLQPGEYVEMQARFNKNDWSSMQQDNDWSYAANQAFAVDSKITGYVNGSLAWGTEPYAQAGTSAQIANVIGFPNPSSSTEGTYLQYEIAGSGGISTQSDSADRSLTSIPDPDAKVMLDIFTSNGRLVWRKELTGVSNVMAGKHTIKWDGKSAAGHKLAPGSYVLKVSIISAGGVSTKNFVLLMLK